VIFALAESEPVLRASVGLDVCFRAFIHRAVPRASSAAAEPEPESRPGHTAAFEAAVLHLVERYGVPHSQPQEKQKEQTRIEAMRSRRGFTLRVLQQIERIVTRVRAGEFANESVARQEERRRGGGEGDEAAGELFSREPTLPKLQQACTFRLQLLNAALMHLPDDDGNGTADMCQKAVKVIKSVCACGHLMSNVLGNTVYRTALASMDRVGALTLAVDWLREHCKLSSECARKFQRDLRQELLQEQMPRFVSEALGADLPLANVRLTSAGIVRHVPQPPAAVAAADAHQSDAAPAQPAEPPARFEDDVSFDVDPWLLLEHNPQGVLKDRLAHAKRRQRKKLKWEHDPPKQQAPVNPAAPPQQRPAYHPASSAAPYAHMQHPHMLQAGAAGGVGVSVQPAYPGYPAQPPASGHYYPHAAPGGYGAGGWG
jgi:hypothetical protein